MKSLTKKQSENIEYLLTNAYADDKDRRALATILRETGKRAYTELTVSEASWLITALVERAVEYKLVCGEKITIERWMAHSIDVMGESKACLDHCPKGVYIGDCKHYQEYEKEIYDDESNEIQE